MSSQYSIYNWQSALYMTSLYCATNCMRQDNPINSWIAEYLTSRRFPTSTASGKINLCAELSRLAKIPMTSCVSFCRGFLSWRKSRIISSPSAPLRTRVGENADLLCAAAICIWRLLAARERFSQQLWKIDLISTGCLLGSPSARWVTTLWEDVSLAYVATRTTVSATRSANGDADSRCC